jgi:hypothetical protein
VRLEGSGQLKNITASGVEPETFRRVAALDGTMINECGAVYGVRIGRGMRSTRIDLSSNLNPTLPDLRSNPSRRGGKLATGTPEPYTASFCF